MSEPTSSAIISDDGRYRYLLTREWTQGAPKLTFVMLNPSTADAREDDPTIRRCIGFAKREGFGGIRVVNLYAFRATDPKIMLREIDPVGPANDTHITGACLDRHVIAAWGANAAPHRVKEVLRILDRARARLFSLGVTSSGAPRHPLYVKGDQPFVPYPTQHPGREQ
jgi:hypothetical protein